MRKNVLLIVSSLWMVGCSEPSNQGAAPLVLRHAADLARPAARRMRETVLNDPRVVAAATGFVIQRTAPEGADRLVTSVLSGPYELACWPGAVSAERLAYWLKLLASEREFLLSLAARPAASFKANEILKGARVLMGLDQDERASALLGALEIGAGARSLDLLALRARLAIRAGDCAAAMGWLAKIPDAGLPASLRCSVWVTRASALYATRRTEAAVSLLLRRKDELLADVTDGAEAARLMALGLKELGDVARARAILQRFLAGSVPSPWRDELTATLLELDNPEAPHSHESVALEAK